MGNVSMYDTAQIARGGFGPAGTGHPPPPGASKGSERPPTFEILGKGLANAHVGADRIEAALDRIDPLHAANVTMALQHLVSRLHRLADRLESHG